MKSFERYLQERCCELHPALLDDYRPDFFDNWLGDLDKESLLIYSEGWGRYVKSYILREVTKITK